MPLRWLAGSVAATALALAGAGAAAAADVLPDAGFGFHPRDAVAGQQVSFRSYACDPDGALTSQAWDFDGNGDFADASGATVLHSFPAGSHAVRLRVTDRAGRTVTSTRRIDVVSGNPDYVEVRPFRPPLLSPFPIVRLAGRVVGNGAQIRLLTVRAPVCSKVTVRCRGASCPFRRRSRLVARRALRVRGIERRLAAGTVLEVLVRKRDRVGKYTRFRIRAGRPPSRVDLCLRFRARAGSSCPSD